MQAATYSLILRDATGTKVAHWSDVLSLAYVRQVNAPGLIHIVLDGAHPVVPLLTPERQIEVWRLLPGVRGWHREHAGLIGALHWQQTTSREATLTVEAEGLLSVLGWRIVAYPANTPQQTRFSATPAGTILWRLVAFNLGADATPANGRTHLGTLPQIDAGDDPATGAVIDWSCAWANVLSEAQRLQPHLGADFDLLPDPLDPSRWQFRLFPGQRGEDRRASVVFAVERGTIANVQRHTLIREVRSVIIVGGPGEEDARRVRVRTGNGYPAVSRERFYDARNAADTDAALDARGDAVVREARRRDQVTFDVLQTAACAYGRDYDLGDLVTRRTFGAEATQQITQITVRWTPSGGEQISVEVQDVE